MTCPECAQGKHGNCDGRAWDLELDEPAICECWTNHEGAE